MIVKVIKSAAYAMVVLVFAGGLLAGAYYGPAPEQIWEEREFSWQIMLLIWAGGGLNAILLYGFGAMLEQMQLISAKLDKLDNIEAAAVLSATRSS